MARQRKPKQFGPSTGYSRRRVQTRVSRDLDTTNCCVDGGHTDSPQEEIYAENRRSSNGSKVRRSRWDDAEPVVVPLAWLCSSRYPVLDRSRLENTKTHKTKSLGTNLLHFQMTLYVCVCTYFYQSNSYRAARVIDPKTNGIQMLIQSRSGRYAATVIHKKKKGPLPIEKKTRLPMYGQLPIASFVKTRKEQTFSNGPHI